MDVAAPGAEISTTQGYDQFSINTIWGTSFSAPQVSALAASILSLNGSLTPVQVYGIITSTADKVGQVTYTNGWNRYLGYGRINAYKALKYTLENYGGTVAAGQTMTLNNETLRFAIGAQITVYGTLNATGTTFTSASPSSTWSGIDINGSGTNGSVLGVCPSNEHDVEG